jgi:hypothetical protein
MSIIQTFLSWIFVTMILIWVMPNSKVKVARNFFKEVLPKIPFVSIIEALKKRKMND